MEVVDPHLFDGGNASLFRIKQGPPYCPLGGRERARRYDELQAPTLPVSQYPRYRVESDERAEVSMYCAESYTQQS